jgi:tRNA A-37 threonylcarbamoyl transferase component Bud32
MHSIQQLQSGELQGAKYIKISENLSTVPPELYQYADTLEILDLSGNALTSLPHDFSRFKKLRILFLSNNTFEQFPQVLSTLPDLDIVGFKANQITEIPEYALPVSLRWLILTDNKITALPHSIGLCVKLQKVMLAGNALCSLPDEMAACKKIELLRISANNIEVLPEWLLGLPRLAWLAFAGNPCSYKPLKKTHQAEEISWNEIAVHEQLGEGASGNIYKAKINDSDLNVAVKIFKGTVTSDGFPIDEMNACIRAGTHPHLVQVKAVIANHPADKEGLVMELIPSDYYNLGMPPDFATCTRDTFADGQVFTIHAIVRIARGIAAAAAHLHEKGIMHGDLYAHNILVNEEYHTLFGDFGAASIVADTDNSAFAARLEKIEVRAYGCLLEDLLNRVTNDSIEERTRLEALKNQCLDENILSRPAFKNILEKLAAQFNK